ncbi:hypothetical protein GCM10011575_17960 [Microlunatus endophyticus]|uniref:Fe/B12 periplasmic-binding domain-containing protein n=1 Tax=Microlunatus endophyticus TaxID=1716077 RepID=A0A917S5K1_9ACTN|nr:ABC transporter substrate-binding protein [Microlunatus endophyticus]GGL59833.1 hypothetical protein GCM10011575_17960 [Microlunatus endophyticus]
MGHALLTTSQAAPAADAIDAETDAEFGVIVDELTRRGFLAGGLGTVGAFGLASCTPDAPSPAVPQTRKIKTANGTVEVPADPRRVVTINAYAYKTMLDLGLTPIMGIAGQVAAGFQIPSYIDRMAKVPSPVDNAGSDKIEQIARAKPDLIFTFAADKAVAQLRALAPTITADPSESWRRLAEQTADVIGRAGQLEKLRTASQRQTQQLASDHAETLRGAKWYVLAPGDNRDWSLWLPDVAAGLILSDLGASFGHLATGRTGQYKPYSVELLDGLSDGDVLLVADGGATPSAQAAALFSTPGWRRLPAVKAGRVYRTNLCSVSSYGEADALLDLVRTICTQLEGNQR